MVVTNSEIFLWQVVWPLSDPKNLEIETRPDAKRGYELANSHDFEAGPMQNRWMAGCFADCNACQRVRRAPTCALFLPNFDSS